MLESIYIEHDHTLYRKLVTGAVDAETGQMVATDFDELQKDEYSTAIVSSASVPGIFPYTELRGKKLIDSLSKQYSCTR